MVSCAARRSPDAFRDQSLKHSKARPIFPPSVAALPCQLQLSDFVADLTGPAQSRYNRRSGTLFVRPYITSYVRIRYGSSRLYHEPMLKSTSNFAEGGNRRRDLEEAGRAPSWRRLRPFTCGLERQLQPKLNLP